MSKKDTWCNHMVSYQIKMEGWNFFFCISTASEMRHSDPDRGDPLGYILLVTL